MWQRTDQVLIEGVVLRLNTPSRHTHFVDYDNKSVVLGPRLVVPNEVAEKWMHTFIGSPICAVSDQTGLQIEPFGQPAPRLPVGFINEVEIIGDALHVYGCLWADAFPEINDEIRDGEPLGLCADMRYPDYEKIDDTTIRLCEAVFAGVSILREHLCGFAGTSLKRAANPYKPLPVGPSVRPAVSVV